MFGGISLFCLAVHSSLTCYEDFIARHSGHVQLIHIVPTAKVSCILLELDDVLVLFGMMYNNLSGRGDCGKTKRKIGF